MQFRPCIDIHDGKVKQIVGGSLQEKTGGETTISNVQENYVSEQNAAFYANMYREDGITGGHIILLNAPGTEAYEADRAEAYGALRAYPKGLQVGGGIRDDNGEAFLEAGASHVIVTSYIFEGGRIHYDRLERMRSLLGREHLVLDLSCRKKAGKYYVVTDRWQVFTEEEVTLELLNRLYEYCDEFLIHAVDAEGKRQGVEEKVVAMMGDFTGTATYAGGVGSFDDLKVIKKLGKNRVNVTIGSALSLFGGDMDYGQVLRMIRESI